MATTGNAHAARVLELINANWTTQALGVAAELGIADALAEGPRRPDELASRTGCHAESLHRLMRALASLELCAERDDGAFELTGMGDLLRANAEPGLRSWAIWTARAQWRLWGGLLESVRSGQSARKLLAGSEGYAHLESDPGAAGLFNHAMVELTHLVADAVARAFDFARVRRLVDVGGGHGELLATLLGAHEHLGGTLFDLPHAMEGARRVMEEAGLAGRCELVAGSFFDAVPAGADAYVLKSILHNWDDARCEAILAQCARAAGSGGRLLLIERVMPERLCGSAAERAVVRADLNMMVSLGGRERTPAEFRALLAGAGFELARCEPIGFAYSLLEAVPRPAGRP